MFSEAEAISTNFRHNHQIRISPIFLIDQHDEKIGQVSLSEAQRRAQEAQMDLVEVAPNARPPVCKIMDYGKWRYQQQKKEHKSSTHKGGRLKMINVDTVRIGEHDLGIKINRARDFLKEGNKVQFTLRFKGRELAHINLGRDLFNRVKHELWQVSKVERDGKMEGKRMTLVLQPEHKNANAKAPAMAAPSPPMSFGTPRPSTNPNVAARLMGPGPGASPGPGGPVGPGINRPAVGPGIARPGVGPGAPIAPRPAAAAPAAPAAAAPAPAAPAESVPFVAPIAPKPANIPPRAPRATRPATAGAPVGAAAPTEPAKP